jgi:hypothetical protein
MTNSELKAKLLQAQDLLADVYHWANEPHSKFTGMEMNEQIQRYMSDADSSINDALEELEYPNGCMP